MAKNKTEKKGDTKGSDHSCEREVSFLPQPGKPSPFLNGAAGGRVRWISFF
jgi:hypothetical protein